MGAATTATPHRDRLRIARHLRRDIDRLVGHRAAGEAERTTGIEPALKSAGRAVWTGLKKHPVAATLIAAGVGVASAELVGLPQVVLGLGFAYIAYEVLRKDMPADEALAELMRIER